MKKTVSSVIAILIIVIFFILLFISTKTHNLYIGFQIIFLFSYGCILIKGIIKNSVNALIDIRLYVVTMYMIYNLYTPIVFIFSKYNYISFYGIVYTKLDILNSLKISIIYFIALSIPFIFSINIKKIHGNIKKTDSNNNLSYKKISFYIWLTLWAGAFAWYIYPYIQLGWSSALSYGRWERYYDFSIISNNTSILDKIFKTLFSSLLLIMANLMCYTSIAFEKELKKERCLFVLLIIFEFIFYLFIDQRRREFMYIVIMTFSYYCFYNYGRINSKKIVKYSICVLILASVFINYQYYRNYFTLAYKKNISYALEVKQTEDIKSSNMDKWYYSEFGCVYINNLCTVKYTPNLFYGKTYLEAVLTPIPIISKILPQWLGYDDDKTSLITKWQANIYPEIFGNGGGFGFSAASEAYLNMGYGGCILFGMIMGWIFNFIYFKLLNSKNIIFYCIILPQGWNFSRETFTGVTVEVFWFVLYYVLYTFIVRVLTGIKD